MTVVLSMQLFITVMDKLRLEIRAMDEVRVLQYGLHHLSWFYSIHM